MSFYHIKSFNFNTLVFQVNDIFPVLSSVINSEKHWTRLNGLQRQVSDLILNR